jgi:hypothetical protein
MANRRQEERERLRQAREERESSRAKESRKRLLAGYVAAGIIGLAVVVGVVIAIASSGGGGGGDLAFINQSSGSTNGVEPDNRQGTEPPSMKTPNLQQAAKKAGCRVQLKLKDEGHEHIAPGTTAPDYKTNPPTSGRHVEPPYQQADGAYDEMPDQIDVVHALEHGRLAIQYAPDLPEQDQLELKGLYESMHGGTLFFPNDNMDDEVAAATWTNLLSCKEYRGEATLDAIRAFGKATWGRYGGEPVNAFDIKGPTPLEPRA